MNVKGMYWVENVLIQKQEMCVNYALDTKALYQYRQICPLSDLIPRSTDTKLKAI